MHARDELGPAGRAVATGMRRCDRGERLLDDLLVRHAGSVADAGRGGCLPGAGDALARQAGIALLDNVRELRACLARLDAVLVRSS